MGYLSFFVCLTLFMISFFKNEKRLSPTVFFLGLWSLILGLSALNLYGLNKPSFEAYALLTIMVIFVFTGSMMTNVVLPFHFKKKKIRTQAIYEPCKVNERIFYILMTISLISSILNAITVLKLYLSGVPLWQIRNWALQPKGSENPILSNNSILIDAFKVIILSPFGAIATPIAAYYFFNPELKKTREAKIMIAYAVISLIISSISGGGGRLGFICFLGYFILGYISFKRGIIFKNYFNDKKYRKVIKILGSITVVVGILFTTLRAGSGSFIKQTYLYFAMPPTLLSQWLPTLKDSAHTYGLLTLFGFHSYAFRFFDAVGLNFLVPAIYDTTYQYILNAERFLDIGSGISNAFVTPVYYFYLDGGIFFTALASLVFGIIISKFYKSYIYNINARTFTFYCLVMYGVFVSFMRIQTCIPSYIISFFMAYILLNRKAKR